MSPVTREQVYFLKYNPKLKAYEYEMNKEKKLSFGTHQPFIRELLKEKSYRQIQEEKKKEENEQKRLERLKNTQTSKRQPRNLSHPKENSMSIEN